MKILLIPGEVSLAQFEDVWRGNDQIELHADVRSAIDAAASLVQDKANGDEAVYGVNTGFGKLANVAIDPEKMTKLQRNLILSHCCGVGKALDARTTRLMMVLKLLSLGRGASGVVWETVNLIVGMVNKGVLPV
ncbi:MAG: aromatic amino acid lyase, partial [Candidatus Puniceispirillum sp.]